MHLGVVVAAPRRKAARLREVGAADSPRLAGHLLAEVAATSLRTGARLRVAAEATSWRMGAHLRGEVAAAIPAQEHRVWARCPRPLGKP